MGPENEEQIGQSLGAVENKRPPRAYQISQEQLAVQDNGEIFSPVEGGPAQEGS